MISSIHRSSRHDNSTATSSNTTTLKPSTISQPTPTSTSTLKQTSLSHYSPQTQAAHRTVTSTTTTMTRDLFHTKSPQSVDVVKNADADTSITAEETENAECKQTTRPRSNQRRLLSSISDNQQQQREDEIMNIDSINSVDVVNISHTEFSPPADSTRTLTPPPLSSTATTTQLDSSTELLNERQSSQGSLSRLNNNRPSTVSNFHPRHRSLLSSPLSPFSASQFTNVSDLLSPLSASKSPVVKKTPGRALTKMMTLDSRYQKRLKASTRAQHSINRSSTQTDQFEMCQFNNNNNSDSVLLSPSLSHTQSTHTIKSVQTSSKMPTSIRFTSPSTRSLFHARSRSEVASVSMSVLSVKSVDSVKSEASESTMTVLDMFRSERSTPVVQLYSDRFIPSRLASNLDHNHYTVTTLQQHNQRSDSENNGTQTQEQKENGDAVATYTALLRTELLPNHHSTIPSPPHRPTNNASTGAQLSHHAQVNALLNSPEHATVDSTRLQSPPISTPPSSSTHPTASPLSTIQSTTSSRTLRFQSPLKSPRLHYHALITASCSPLSIDSLSVLSSKSLSLSSHRRISKAPFKVLDAPALKDDFYLNLVDWSCQNVVCVGLGSSVYLWSALTSQVTKLCELVDPNADANQTAGDDLVTSVCWSVRGNHVAVGTNTGDIQIWDVHKCKLIRTMKGHIHRIGTLSWSQSMLASGGRDRTIFLRDIRSKQDYTYKLIGHKQEVCGLKWSPDCTQLASGSNDNKLLIWSPHSTSPLLKFTDHVAAVKAIAWSPHQCGLLASGGGTADRCIRFWNTLQGTALSHYDTGSQVCNILWSRNANELVSTHGYSLNQIIVWKYPQMKPIATLTGHTLRVLYLAASPDGQTIVTGAGDETLRFWNVFQPAPKSDNKDSVSLFSPPNQSIR